MRLDKSRSSRNVEDRRANGPRLSGGKIGLGTIVLAWWPCTLGWIPVWC